MLVTVGASCEYPHSLGVRRYVTSEQASDPYLFHILIVFVVVFQVSGMLHGV